MVSLALREETHAVMLNISVASKALKMYVCATKKQATLQLTSHGTTVFKKQERRRPLLVDRPSLEIRPRRYNTQPADRTQHLPQKDEDNYNGTVESILPEGARFRDHG